MKNKTALAFILGGMAGTAMLAGSFAYQGTPGQTNPDPTDLDRHNEVQEMIENQNYETFQELFENKGPSRLIDSQEKFEKWIELKSLYENGNEEQAQELASELGLGQRLQNGEGYGKGSSKTKRSNGDCEFEGENLGQGQNQGQGMGQGRKRGNNR